MQSVIKKIEEKYRKPQVVDVKSGDTVRVHQKIREGSKERVQAFEGLVIRTDRKNSHTATITVRRVTGGVGVEKSYLIHSPLVTKIEVIKRSKVRRKYLTYMRSRTGKSARLTGVDFDKQAVNSANDAKKGVADKADESAPQEEPETPPESQASEAEAKPEDKPESKSEDKGESAQKSDQETESK